MNTNRRSPWHNYVRWLSQQLLFHKREQSKSESKLNTTSMWFFLSSAWSNCHVCYNVRDFNIEMNESTLLLSGWGCHLVYYLSFNKRCQQCWSTYIIESKLRYIPATNWNIQFSACEFNNFSHRIQRSNLFFLCRQMWNQHSSLLCFALESFIVFFAPHNIQISVESGLKKIQCDEHLLTVSLSSRYGVYYASFED